MQKLTEYIPLIIIAGSIIFSIINSVRRKMKEVVVLQQKTQRPDVDTKQYTMYQKNTENIMKVPVKKTQEKWVRTTSKLKSFDEESASHPDFSYTDTEESALPVFDISDGNELKKIIIYAEIINRKEY
jgi:hypothetical protein